MHSCALRLACAQALWANFPLAGHGRALCMLHARCLTTCMAGGELHETALLHAFDAAWPTPMGLLLAVSAAQAKHRAAVVAVPAPHGHHLQLGEPIEWHGH